MSSRNAGFRCVPRGVFVTKQWNRERQRTSNFPSMITRTMVWHSNKQTCKQTQTNKEGILWKILLLTWDWVVLMGIAYFEFPMDCTLCDKLQNWHLHWTECAHFSTLMLFTLPCLCTCNWSLFSLCREKLINNWIHSEFKDMIENQHTGHIDSYYPRNWIQIHHGGALHRLMRGGLFFPT